MARPLLLMDVDGVLALRAPAPVAYREHVVVGADGGRHRVWLDAAHGGWLTGLAERFDVVWATGWEHDAPRILGGLLGVPAFPVLTFTERPRAGVPFAKLPDVRALAADRAVAWVDDAHGAEAVAWAADRSAPTLLVRPSAREGLLREHVDALVAFAGSASVASHVSRSRS